MVFGDRPIKYLVTDSLLKKEGDKNTMVNIPKIIDIYQKKRRNLVEAKIFTSLTDRLYLIFMAIVNILAWLSTRFIYTEIDQERMALHYNVDFGIDYYGEISKVFVLPFIGLIIILVNILVYFLLLKHKDRKFISHILFLVAITTNLILLVAIALIYLVNFS